MINKNFKKARTLLNTDIFLVVLGLAYFVNKDNNTWLSIETELDDGFYKIDKDEIVPIKDKGLDPNDFIPKFNKTDFVADVKDVPYNIHTLVGKEGCSTPGLRYLYLDPDNNCIVASNGLIFHKRDIAEEVKSSLLISPVVWKLMHHFKLTEIHKDEEYLIVTKDNVTITSLLVKKTYPNWSECVPEHKPSISFTQEIKDKILSAIKSFESQGNISFEDYGSLGIVFQDTYIKTKTKDGRCFQIDLGTELFPDEIMGFEVDLFKKFLKVCGTGTLHYPATVYSPVAITDDNDSITLIMHNHTKYRLFDIESWISLDAVKSSTI